MHSVRPKAPTRGASPDAIYHWFGYRPYLAELRGLLARYGGWLMAHEPGGWQLRGRLACLLARCADALSSGAACPGRRHVPLCLCRVDPNLANTVWDGSGSVRWVDWEYAGWGDPALDLADVRWHVSLEGVSRDDHAWLREHYQRPEDDAGFERRLAAWDDLLATRWPFLLLRALWSAHNGPDRTRPTRSQSGPDALRAQFLRTLERAEGHVL